MDQCSVLPAVVRSSRPHSVDVATIRLGAPRPVNDGQACASPSPPSPTPAGTAATRRPELSPARSPDCRAARINKRLSLQFPIQTSNGGNIRSGGRDDGMTPLRTPARERGALLALKVSLPPPGPASTAGMLASPQTLSPTESPTGTRFMTVLAAHERRVLELREELHKAERELDRLKQRWATKEVRKSRSEAYDRAHHLLHLDPPKSGSCVSSPVIESGVEEMSGSSLWLQRELERRRLAIRPSTKTPQYQYAQQRTVFGGSKHTRALSLLSPDRGVFTPTLPAPVEEGVSEHTPKKSRHGTKAKSHSRAQSLDKPAALASLDSDSAAMHKDALIRTGKQMAADLRQGLWTFFEDLRQAAVGDDVPQAPTSKSTRVPAGRKPAKRASKAVDAGSPAYRKTNATDLESNVASVEQIPLYALAEKRLQSAEKSQCSTPLAGRGARITARPRTAEHARAEDGLAHWTSWDGWRAPSSESESTASSSTTASSAASTTARSSVAMTDDSSRTSISSINGQHLDSTASLAASKASRGHATRRLSEPVASVAAGAASRPTGVRRTEDWAAEPQKGYVSAPLPPPFTSA